MIENIARYCYHTWIDYKRNSHFKGELISLKKKSIHPILKLPNDYKNEIIKYYYDLGYKNIDLSWHQYIYSQTGKMDVKFIPENLYHSIIEPCFTRTKTDWEDKAYMSRFLPDANFPETVVRNVNGYYIDNLDTIISIDEVIQLMQKYDSLIIKPTIESGSGRGVKLIKKEEYGVGLFDKYGKNFIIQRPIKQSQVYAQFNKSSVNTEKIISLLFEGEVYILTSILRVGAEGAITDTASTGEGYTIGINTDGNLNSYGYSIHGKTMDRTNDGTLFSEIMLSKHTEILNIIKREHKKLPYFGIISWDFAVDENENVVLIEYNLNYPDVLIYQMNNGALFGDLTEKILERCKTRQ